MKTKDKIFASILIIGLILAVLSDIYDSQTYRITLSIFCILCMFIGIGGLTLRKD